MSCAPAGAEGTVFAKATLSKQHAVTARLFVRKSPGVICLQDVGNAAFNTAASNVEIRAIPGHSGSSFVFLACRGIWCCLVWRDSAISRRSGHL